MKIFEKAKLAEVREEFVSYLAKSRKYREEQLSEMKEYIMGDDCVRDLERLGSGDYFLDYPSYRLVPKNFKDKKRAVYTFAGTQGYLMKLLVYAMRGMESVYSDRLFSFRPDKTGMDLLLEISRDRNIQNMYVLKTDVSNYVGSIVPELIIPMLKEVFLPDDPDFFSFLKWLLTRNKVIDKDGRILDHCPGGMGGVPVGNFFMNLYLHEMDDYFAPRAGFYSRYSDDILICAGTYEEIKDFEKHFYEIMDRLRLATNREKTVILMPGEPFDLMGMELSGGRIRISGHTMKKIKRKIRKYTDQALINRNRGRHTPEEAAHELIMRFNSYFFGAGGSGNRLTWARWVFPVITDTDCLKEIDAYIQESIRYVLYGSMKKRKNSIPYEKLSELGYKTIVYSYHHQDRIRETG
ncbi:MAG: hypothetical protein K5770_07050 [Lachnospiraceae bacterium]|nr:hypothetical protein [Lachnospiraceae bacterium]